MEHGGGVMVLCWWHRDLFRIQGTLNQQGYYSILNPYAIPSGLRLVGEPFVFQQDNDPTHLHAVRAILQRRRVKECCIRWPGLHNHSTSTQLRWVGMSWAAEWRKSSQQVLSICGNSFKTVGKDFQVKLVQNCHQVIKTLFWLLHDSICVIS